MGSKYTARYKIDKCRSTVMSATQKGKPAKRKMLEAMMALEGSTKRHAREIIQNFIDAGEFTEMTSTIDGEKILKYNFPEDEEINKILEGEK